MIETGRRPNVFIGGVIGGTISAVCGCVVVIVTIKVCLNRRRRRQKDKHIGQFTHLHSLFVRF
jgi:uncharacterized protein (DUF2062 family)